MLKIFGFGFSHTVAIKQACNRYQNFLSQKGVEVKIINMHVPALQPWRTKAPANADDGFMLNQTLRNELQNHGADFVFSCIGGNAHNIFGLVNHPTVFDFVLAEKPDLPCNNDGYIVPYTVVKEALASVTTIELAGWLIKETQAVVGKIDVHVESPPPIPSEQHILKNPATFQEKIDQLGVSPRWLRYKLWRVHSQIFKEICGQNLINFLSVPSIAVDSEGFLKETMWGQDATHANILYGKCVLEQIVSQCIQGFRLPSASEVI